MNIPLILLLCVVLCFAETPSCGLPLNKLALEPSQTPDVSITLIDPDTFTLRFEVVVPYDPLTAAVVGFVPYNPVSRGLNFGYQCENRVSESWDSDEGWDNLEPLSAADLDTTDIRFPGPPNSGIWNVEYTCSTVTYILEASVIDLYEDCQLGTAHMISRIVGLDSIGYSGDLHINIVTTVTERGFEEFVVPFSVFARTRMTSSVTKNTSPAAEIGELTFAYGLGDKLEFNQELTFDEGLYTRACGFEVDADIADFTFNTANAVCDLDTCDVLCLSSCNEGKCLEDYSAKSHQVIRSPLNAELTLSWNTMSCSSCNDSVDVSTPDIITKVDVESIGNYEYDAPASGLLTYTRVENSTQAALWFRDAATKTGLGMDEVTICTETQAGCIDEIVLVSQGESTGECGAVFDSSDRAVLLFSCTTSRTADLFVVSVSDGSQISTNVPVFVEPTPSLEAVYDPEAVTPVVPVEDDEDDDGVRRVAVGAAAVFGLVALLM
ncbi:hypothetical protein J8273_8604 [Carpediemonas membranifera]|uniref:Uncharacterized protein n=1 Tax=Carpediemonas membranifera TaxID=201153 RepID=A0A8J6E0Y1_9EUKA|nr:hypothetical protein J8273_8604 [Carpediemonas membranifera]|eukprot:KAG9389917.1 hypothetical protein J8273_8604 [Carpediemonas membranifera]